MEEISKESKVESVIIVDSGRSWREVNLEEDNNEIITLVEEKKTVMNFVIQREKGKDWVKIIAAHLTMEVTEDEVIDVLYNIINNEDVIESVQKIDISKNEGKVVKGRIKIKIRKNRREMDNQEIENVYKLSMQN